MFSRLLLLTFATGLFMFVWNAPAQPRRPRSATTRPVVPPAPVVSTQTAVLPDPFLAGDLPTGTSTAIRATAVSQAEPALPPLPSDITPGAYCVVDQTGSVQRIVVGESQLPCQAAGACLPRNVYEVESAGRRFCFVRIEETTLELLITAPDGEVEIRDRRFNRKFDFTGYVETPVAAETEDEATRR